MRSQPTDSSPLSDFTAVYTIGRERPREPRSSGAETQGKMCWKEAKILEKFHIW